MSAKNRTFYIWIALLLLFIMAARTPVDTDLWWHLRAGEETLSSGSPLLADPFSHTKMGSYWNNHSWVSQIFLFSAYSMGGFLGLGLLMAILAVLAMYLVSRQMGNQPIVDAFFLVFGGIIASVNWVARPQIFSLVFLALTGLIFRSSLKHASRWVWILLPLFIIWGNFHGGYPLGLILIGCYLAGEIFRYIFLSSGKLGRDHIILLMGISLFSYLLTAVNPNGLRTLLIPFQTVGVEGLQNLISEWASPDFHQPLQLLFLVYFIFAFWILIFSKKSIELSDLIILTVFGSMGFIARRNFAPFILVSLPILSKYFDLEGLISLAAKGLLPAGFKEIAQRSVIRPGFQMGINLFMIIILVLAGAIKIWAVTGEDFVSDYLASTYPVDAMEWASENVMAQPIVNEYNWGGYLIWQYPSFPVFIDGRTDLFGDEIINEWLGILNCSYDWETTLERRGVQMLVLSPERPVIHCALDSGWNTVFKDDVAVILLQTDHE